MKAEKSVVKGTTAVATAPEYNMEDMEGMGTEQATADDFAIPFVHIAQALSPQIEEGDAKYIAELKKGQLFNSVTGEIYSGGVNVVPVMFERKILEFKTRDSGGGLVAMYDDVAEGLARVAGKDDRGMDVTAEGNQIVDTRSFYCVLQRENGTTEYVLVSMKSTQTKKAKQWLSLIRGIKRPRSNGQGFFNPPMFATLYHIGTAKEENAKGSWHGFVLSKAKDLEAGDEVFQEAAAFYDSLRSGEVKANYANIDGDAPATEDEEGEIPY